MGGEVLRLQSLKQKNPAIRDDEIEWATRELDRSFHFISQAQLRLDAIRLIKVD